MPKGVWRVRYKRKPHIKSLWSSASIRLSLAYPIVGTVPVGTVEGGEFSDTQDCEDSTTWDIIEVDGGLDVEFTFSTGGSKAKKIKVKGKADSGKTYSLLAYNWTTDAWDTVALPAFDTETQTYTAAVGSEYTEGGVVKVRVYTGSNNNNKIYLDCVYVITTANPDTQPSPSLATPSGNEIATSADEFIQASGY